jgi:hypothetical protein
MNPTSVMALFCDDIREEKSGALTLIGVLGDNVTLPPLPPDGGNIVGIIPRIAIYLRINFDVNAEIGPITFKITMPDGAEIDAGGISEATIAEAKDTGKSGSPIGGIISRLVFGNVPLRKAGRMTVEATVGDTKYLAGALNFMPEVSPANS